MVPEADQHALAEATVAVRAAELLYPRVLVRGTAWLVSWPPIQSVSSVRITDLPILAAASAAA